MPTEGPNWYANWPFTGSVGRKRPIPGSVVAWNRSGSRPSFSPLGPAASYRFGGGSVVRWWFGGGSVVVRYGPELG
jgi:hypothetical protein